MSKKYYFVCKSCKTEIPGFHAWFGYGQKCPSCGSKYVDTMYYEDPIKLKSLIYGARTVPSLWHYFDFLPVDNRENIVSAGEGLSALEQWGFLEQIAREKHGINCKVFAFRSNYNNATRTFKDIAGSLGASVLKEMGIDEYVVASTGNTANAFSHYLAAAGISLSVFMPQDAVPSNIAEVSSYGQKAFKVKGDYAMAKKIAAEYAALHNIHMTIGNVDPIRVESKKTWVFDWLSLMPEFPTVYIQALSGGTGPIAIEKALIDIKDLGLVSKSPRYLSIQPDKCAPMSHAWQKAKLEGFPEGYQKNYPIYENPETSVPTLATGNPVTYPIMADLTKKSGGDIIEFEESKMVDVARLVAYETTVRIGPASTISAGGYFNALKQGLIKNGDVVLLNLGEGIRRAPDFLKQLSYNISEVNAVSDCERFDRKKVRKMVWDPILNY